MDDFFRALEMAKAMLEEEKPTRTWTCTRTIGRHLKQCGELIERYRGMNDIQCVCGAWYNSFGQRLRDDWQDNPSNYDENISDLEGYEIEHARKDY